MQRLLILDEHYLWIHHARYTHNIVCIIILQFNSLASYWSPYGYSHRLPKKALPTTSIRAVLVIVLDEMWRGDVDFLDLNGPRVEGEEGSLQWPTAIQ